MNGETLGNLVIIPVSVEANANGINCLIVNSIIFYIYTLNTLLMVNGINQLSMEPLLETNYEWNRWTPIIYNYIIYWGAFKKVK